jgi:hypothetical protein
LIDPASGALFSLPIAAQEQRARYRRSLQGRPAKRSIWAKAVRRSFSVQQVLIEGSDAPSASLIWME